MIQFCLQQSESGGHSARFLVFLLSVCFLFKFKVLLREMHLVVLAAL